MDKGKDCETGKVDESGNKICFFHDEDILTQIANIDLSEYENLRIIIPYKDQGNICRCFAPGFSLGSDSEVVVVAARKVEEPTSELSSDISKLDEEALALSKLRHPNLVHFFGRGTLDGERILVFEYYSRTLAGEIKKGRETGEYLTSLLFARWASEIASALCYLNENSRVHGDLKPSKILIDYYDVTKLSDFCLSTDQKQGSYIAPEEHAGDSLHLEGLQRCDVWAYGVILWEMVTCRTLFEGIDNEADRIAIVIGANDEHSHPVLPLESPFDLLVNLLKRCWNANSSDRPTFNEIARVLPDIYVQFDKEFYKGAVWMEECMKWADHAQSFTSP